MRNHPRTWCCLALATAAVVMGCNGSGKTPPAASIDAKTTVQPVVGMQQRFGDEIVVAGQFYRIGTPVVTWMDPGGFDAYRTERRFAKYEESDYEATVQPLLTRAAATTQRAADRAAQSGETLGRRPTTRNVLPNPSRYNLRYGEESAVLHRTAATRPALMDPANWASPTTRPLTPEELEQVRGGGWSLELLQRKVDQFVLHYDVAGTSRFCFNILQDNRNLSVTFMLDLDGTIYQTLDVKERSWHATKSNSRSVGIEIANMGSYSTRESTAALDAWYKKDENGQTYITIPQRFGGMDSQRTKPSILRPARNDMIVGQIRGQTQRQYDLTPQQYDALIKLTAALCDIFPNMKCDYPRGPDGKLLTRTLTDEEFNVFGGVIGHYHVQTNKSDPGVALQWDLLIEGARKELAERRKTNVVAK